MGLSGREEEFAGVLELIAFEFDGLEDFVGIAGVFFVVFCGDDVDGNGQAFEGFQQGRGIQAANGGVGAVHDQGPHILSSWSALVDGWSIRIGSFGPVFDGERGCDHGTGAHGNDCEFADIEGFGLVLFHQEGFDGFQVRAGHEWVVGIGDFHGDGLSCGRHWNTVAMFAKVDGHDCEAGFLERDGGGLPDASIAGVFAGDAIGGGQQDCAGGFAAGGGFEPCAVNLPAVGSWQDHFQRPIFGGGSGWFRGRSGIFLWIGRNRRTFFVCCGRFFGLGHQ